MNGHVMLNRAICALTGALACAGSIEAQEAARPAVTTEAHALADSVIRLLASAARDGQEKLVALRGNQLGDERTFAVAVHVPDSWTCRLRIEPTYTVVSCGIVGVADSAASEFDRLAARFRELVGKKGWREDPFLPGHMVRDGVGIERAVEYGLRRDRRTVARMSLWLGPVRGSGGTTKQISLRATAYPRPR